MEYTHCPIVVVDSIVCTITSSISHKCMLNLLSCRGKFSNNNSHTLDHINEFIVSGLGSGGAEEGKGLIGVGLRVVQRGVSGVRG